MKNKLRKKHIRRGAEKGREKVKEFPELFKAIFELSIFAIKIFFSFLGIALEKNFPNLSKKFILLFVIFV